MSAVTLRVAGLATNAMAFHNSLYVPTALAATLCPGGADGRNYAVAEVAGQPPRVVMLRASDTVAAGTLAMATFHRTLLGVAADDAVGLRPWVRGSAGASPAVAEAVSARLRLKMVSRQRVAMDEDDMVEHVQEAFGGHAVHAGQQFATQHKRAFMLTVEWLGVAPPADEAKDATGAPTADADCAVITADTQITITAEQNPVLEWKKTKKAARVNLNRNIKFEDMGIGGLDAEFDNIIRRAFATRLMPAEKMRRMGMNHVKGMLLYGPPGTGKTLIARQIGKLLEGREPKIVNGPEILNKYVGASEENIRKLFEDAEQDQAENGDDADLHIIIFDELDAICKRRGSVNSGTGVHDTIVNQILSKMDGVESLNNILVIGMTNRKDMIDPALLRPGRLEVHLEISLPNEVGRVQIINIHTQQMRKNGFLGDDFNEYELAKLTPNFSGAEIEGLVRSAQSFAIRPSIDVKDIATVKADMEIKVTMDHFMQALGEVRPAFGVSDQDLESAVGPGGLCSYGPAYDNVYERVVRALNQVRKSESTPLQSVLLQGPSGCGKTAIAAHVALGAGRDHFPFVRIISPNDLVGLTENQKVNRVNGVFEDAYRSDSAIVIVDSIERLLEYVPVAGMRFSNAMLQALWVLVKREPPALGADAKRKNRARKRMLVIGTTNDPTMMRRLGLDAAFNIVTDVPQLETVDEVRRVLDEKLSDEVTADVRSAMADRCDRPVSIKNLLLVVEMARQHDEGITLESFGACLDDVHRASRLQAAKPTLPVFEGDDEE